MNLDQHDSFAVGIKTIIEYGFGQRQSIIVHGCV